MPDQDRDNASERPPGATASAARIAADLRLAIERGVYADNDRLPPERQLADHFGASRGTIREALRRLEDTNLVIRKVGSGTFVRYHARENDEDIAKATSPIELIDVRFGIEPQMVASAARLGLRVAEVPVNYAPRGMAAGKKIGWRDGVRALMVIARERLRGDAAGSGG